MCWSALARRGRLSVQGRGHWPWLGVGAASSLEAGVDPDQPRVVRPLDARQGGVVSHGFSARIDITVSLLKNEDV